MFKPRIIDKALHRKSGLQRKVQGQANASVDSSCSKQVHSRLRQQDADGHVERGSFRFV
jgi:hypothetical protein